MMLTRILIHISLKTFFGFISPSQVSSFILSYLLNISTKAS